MAPSPQRRALGALFLALALAFAGVAFAAGAADTGGTARWVVAVAAAAVAIWFGGLGVRAWRSR